jgi:hypothetical protein
MKVYIRAEWLINVSSLSYSLLQYTGVAPWVRLVALVLHTVVQRWFLKLNRLYWPNQFMLQRWLLCLDWLYCTCAHAAYYNCGTFGWTVCMGPPFNWASVDCLHGVNFFYFYSNLHRDSKRRRHHNANFSNSGYGPRGDNLRRPNAIPKGVGGTDWPIRIRRLPSPPPLKYHWHGILGLKLSPQDCSIDAEE